MHPGTHTLNLTKDHFKRFDWKDDTEKQKLLNRQTNLSFTDRD